MIEITFRSLPADFLSPDSTPSCAKQLDEDWMGPFLAAVTTQPGKYCNVFLIEMHYGVLIVLVSSL